MTVFIYPWTGAPQEANRVGRSLYPEATLEVLSHRAFRELGWRGQLRAFGGLKGQALLFFFKSIEDTFESQLLALTGLVHGCERTVLADEAGFVRVYRRVDLLKRLPAFLLSGLCDSFVLAASYIYLATGRGRKPVPFSDNEGEKLKTYDIAYLYPFPLDRASVGGALTHVGGVLSGFAAQGARVKIFSGRPLDSKGFLMDIIPSTRKNYLLRESLLLSYNWQFAKSVGKELRSAKIGALYQRHGRFVIVGALLSRSLRVPLVLEYNGSENWVAQHWDPSRFRRWLRLAEACALGSAALILVVSEALRDELLNRGIPRERILVTPNAVDPDAFRPGCGGTELRAGLGFNPDDVVVGFLGTFSYWHGVSVLKEAIHRLLDFEEDDYHPVRIRFLLIGQGPLHAELRQHCSEFERRGLVGFTGAVPHERVPAYLDAADILVSPHIPMPDGRPFFGSPTKLFEYMAAEKAIIASDLDQIGRVLSHKTTALLTAPGDSVDLARSIRLLAQDPEMRRRLGQAARETALARHTWSQNAARLIAYLSSPSVRAAGSQTSKDSDDDSKARSRAVET